MITRRRILEMTGAAGAVAWSGIAIPRPIKGEGAIADLLAALPQGLREEAVLDALPGKKPLIKLSYRPPNYETPLRYMRTPVTSNDAFFVRYHLPDIPEINAAEWKLAIGGDGANDEM